MQAKLKRKILAAHMFFLGNYSDDLKRTTSGQGKAFSDVWMRIQCASEKPGTGKHQDDSFSTMLNFHIICSSKFPDNKPIFSLSAIVQMEDTNP